MAVVKIKRQIAVAAIAKQLRIFAELSGITVSALITLLRVIEAGAVAAVAIFYNAPAVKTVAVIISTKEHIAVFVVTRVVGKFRIFILNLPQRYMWHRATQLKPLL